MKRTKRFEPLHLMCVYSNGESYYIEHSPVSNGNLSSGWKPISEEFIKKIITNFAIKESKISFGGYVPVNVVGYAEGLSNSTLIWHTPEMTQTLQFKKDKKEQMPEGKHRVPPLLWIFQNGLTMYSFKNWDGKKTELHWAPFWNISDNHVCLGTASNYVGEGKFFTFEDIMRRVQTAFFDSTFTHAGSETNVALSFQGLYEKTLNAKTYPYEYLVRTNKTLGDICNHIFKT